VINTLGHHHISWMKLPLHTFLSFFCFSKNATPKETKRAITFHHKQKKEAISQDFLILFWTRTTKVKKSNCNQKLIHRLHINHQAPNVTIIANFQCLKLEHENFNHERIIIVSDLLSPPFTTSRPHDAKKLLTFHDNSN